MGSYRFVLLFLFLGAASMANQACNEPISSDEEKESDKNDDNLLTDLDVDTESENEEGCEHIVILSSETSPKISTVGIIEWASDGEVSDAYIEFGPVDGDYRWKAPADLEDSKYRTLLLGMKTDSEYKYRIVATVDGEECVSGKQTIETGALPVGMPNLFFEGSSSGGFIVTTSFIASVMGNTSTWDGAFILDEDGDFVWWYNSDERPVDWVRARISYDGKYMWLANGNYPDFNGGMVIKVRMDGTEEEVISLPRRHHDLLELPFDGILAYMEYEKSGAGTCDQVMERLPDGTTSVVFKVRDHFGHREVDEEWCHTNALNYVESEDAYYLSVLYQNMILKVKRETGELLWTMGGLDSDFPGIWWDSQHQHHLLEDSILLFNNNGGATDESVVSGEEELVIKPVGSSFWDDSTSHAVEFSFDEDDKTASLIWDYSDDVTGSFSMGDAKRLPNGNTQIVYSAAGVIQEVTPEKEKIFQVKWNGIFGYASRRESLYAVPPEYEYYPNR